MISSVEIAVNYLKKIEATRRVSTTSMYEWHLTSYFKYLKVHDISLHDSDADDIINYLSSNSKWTSVTRNHALSIIKGFYQYYIYKIPILTDNDLRFRLNRESQVREIQTLSQYKKKSSLKQKALTLEEVKRLLIYAKKNNYNDFCYLYCLFYFGCRKGEFRQLQINKNIFLNENKLLITADISKTNTDRVLYFNDYVKNILLYLNKKYGNEKQLVNIDISFLNKLFAKYDKIVGRHIYPHSARHTFVTEELKFIKGKINADENIIIKLLAGHSSNDMTQHYSSYGDKLKEIMIKYHYLSQIELT